MSLGAGRFHAAPSELFTASVVQPMLNAELAAFEQYVDVDCAHTVMLVEQGVLDRPTGALILRGLESIRAIGRERFPLEADDTLLVQFEAFLTREIGERAAGAMHTGRSRNDQMAAAYRLRTRDELIGVLEALAELQDACLSVARRTVRTLIPGFTHLQHAQPISMAHYLLRHMGIFERDQQRLEETFARVNLNSLGGAAMAGTSWPLDRDRTAALLGFGAVIENSIDAGIFNTDYPAEVAAGLALAVTNLGRIAADLYIWSTTEFGLIEVADEFAGTSSIMPQKKNPEPFERVIALAGVAAGWPASALGVVRGVTSSDLGHGFVGSDLPDMAAPTASAARLLAATLETMQIRDDRGRQLVTDDWSTASALADLIVKATDLSFRQAHQIVGRTVRNALTEEIRPSDVDAAYVSRAAGEVLGIELELADADIRRALDPDEFIASRTTVGSPNSDQVTRALDNAVARQRKHRDWLRTVTHQRDQARAELERQVATLVT